MNAFPTLTQAARAWIALRQATLNAVPSHASIEDRTAVEQGYQAIESEIAGLTQLWEKAMAIAEMTHPSVEQILRRRGYRFEADRIAELVQLVMHLQPQK